MWPFEVLMELGQYFVALVVVSPGHMAKLLALMACRQVDLTGKPAAEW